MTLSLIAVSASLFVLLVVVLCAFGTIPPNRLVGLRTRSTLQSPEAWRLVHRRAIVPLVVTTVIVIGCWLLSLAGWLSDEAAMGLGLTILMVGLIGGWAYGTRGLRGDPGNE